MNLNIFLGIVLIPIFSCNTSSFEYGEYQIHYSYQQLDSVLISNTWQVDETMGDTIMASEILDHNHPDSIRLKFFYRSFITFVSAGMNGQVYSFSDKIKNVGNGSSERVEGDLWLANDSLYLDYYYREYRNEGKETIFVFITGRGRKL